MAKGSGFKIIGVAIVFIVGIGLSIASYSAIHQVEEREARAEFQRSFQNRVNLISSALKQRIDLLRFIAGLYHASGGVSRKNFGLAVSPYLGTSKGIQALEWIPRVTDAQREEFEGKAAREFPGFRFTQRESQGLMVTATRRKEYYPVFFVEPLQGNRAALGFDLASNPKRRQSLEKARDTGEIQASAPITLVQEGETEKGILVFNPVYLGGEIPTTLEERRSRLRGFALGEFRVGATVEAALQTLESKRVHIELHDITLPDSPVIMGTHPSPPTQNDLPREGARKAGLYTVSTTFTVAGRTWRIAGYAHHEVFQRAQNLWQSQLMLVSGVVVTVVLTLYLMMFVRRSQAVESLVKIRTHEVSESRSRLDAVINNVVDGIITINGQGLIQSVNPAANKLFGYVPGELDGQNVKVLVPSPHHENHDSYLTDYHSTGHAKVIGKRREMEGQRKDGSVFPLELAVTELMLDAENWFVGITRDITERKEVERLKEEFISTVSHELRTPLTVILGYLPLLSKAEKLPDAGMIVKMAEAMEKSGSHLLNIVNDLLDLSRIEKGEFLLEVQELDAAESVRSVMEEMSPEAEKRGLEITMNTIPCRVRADRIRLHQILLNLVSNAVKFSREGYISLSLGFDETTKEAEFSVRDTGPGIPEPFQKTIFDRFKQVDGSSTRKESGTGLGLAITRNLVELHGGRIRVESQEGKGANFIFTIPLV